MGDRRPRLRGPLLSEVTRTLLLFVTASALGLLSVLLFIFSPGNEPTRFQLALLVLSMVVVFYLTIRSTPV